MQLVFFLEREEIRNKCFIFHLISCSRCKYNAIWSRLVDKIHFGLVVFLAVCSLSLERLPSVQQQGTDVNELL